MESRFTLKDFVFVVLFIVVIGAVVWAIYQSNYQETRLNDVKTQLERMNGAQKDQLAVLMQIRDAVRNGVRVSGTMPSQGDAGGTEVGTASAPSDGTIRRTNPDGSVYVYSPQPPKTPRDPVNRPDYAAGDWLVQNMGVEPKVVTPLIEKDLYGQLAQGPVLETLVTQDLDSFLYEPLLAESYYISGDGLTYRFTLRKGITFSDGTPITIEDVLFSYRAIVDPSVDCAPLRSYLGSVKSCEKVDDRTVEFKMSEPYFGALNTLGLLQILPEHVYKYKTGDEFNNRGALLVGSGPYMLQSWDRGQRLVYVRNDHYWGERPTFDKMIFTFIQNPQASFQALQAGQLDALVSDFSGEPQPDQYVKFSADPEFLKHFKAYKYPSPIAGFSFLGYNEARPFFKDKETRQALTMLIDRNAIIHSIMKDMAVPCASSFSPSSPQHDPAVKPLPYDVEAAKAKLAAAGWKPGSDGILVRNGVRFEFDMSMGANNPIAERIANYVKEQFAHAGISMRITPWEFAVLMQRVDDRTFDAIMMGFSSLVEDDPYQMFATASIADKGSNCIGFSNAESDRLMQEARRTMDQGKRMELWHQWERVIADEQPETFLYDRLERAFVADRFKNTEPYKMGMNPEDWYVPRGQQKYK